MLVMEEVIAQPAITWNNLPSLPDRQGFAGMFAGVSHGSLLALGGANFSDKFPWEGGKKKWYNDIFVLSPDQKWIKIPGAMSQPLGYGVSFSYQDKVIVVGGNNENGHVDRVSAYQWDGKKILASDYPKLPITLANMGGVLLSDVIVVFGGSETSTGSALKKCFGLDLKNVSAGWFELECWPGLERVLPVCGVYKGKGYLFGGETTSTNAKGEKYRKILLDGYRLSLQKNSNKWKAQWEKLVEMPRGLSAAGQTLPLLGDRFLIWGGVDGVVARYKTAATHPGITKSLLFYFPETDSWEYLGDETDLPARVTLPVTFFQDQWVYVSGEVKAGVRTPAITGVRGSNLRSEP